MREQSGSSFSRCFFLFVQAGADRSHSCVAFRHKCDERKLRNVTTRPMFRAAAWSSTVCSPPGGQPAPGSSISCHQKTWKSLQKTSEDLKRRNIIMQARISNPATPETVQAIQSLLKATREGGVPQKTLELVHLRASQINGCSFCVDSGAKSAKRAGETDERLFAVVAWREAPYFTEAERAALALTEAVTRLSDRPDAVPDEIWDEAAKHYDKQQLAPLILGIATTNLFNRLNATIREPTGATWG